VIYAVNYCVVVPLIVCYVFVCHAAKCMLYIMSKRLLLTKTYWHCSVDALNSFMQSDIVQRVCIVEWWGEHIFLYDDVASIMYGFLFAVLIEVILL